MKWLIPAKTFLLGEYAAITEASALLLTTTPCFELSVTSNKGLSEIHPNSPAGLFWEQQKHKEIGLSWHDPYANLWGLGGVGASSAQFLASYLASCFIQERRPSIEQMLNTYYQISWSKKGLRPSGYDVIAQSQQECVYINKSNNVIQTYTWPFHNLSFFLVHTGIKLATHYHLQNTALPGQIDYLSVLVDECKQAFEQANSQQLINSINRYHKKLTELNLVAQHSSILINQLQQHSEILAVKGCGALGADVLLVVTSRQNALTLNYKLNAENLMVLATEKSLFSGSPLIKA